MNIDFKQIFFFGKIFCLKIVEIFFREYFKILNFVKIFFLIQKLLEDHFLVILIVLEIKV